MLFLKGGVLSLVVPVSYPPKMVHPSYPPCWTIFNPQKGPKGPKWAPNGSRRGPEWAPGPRMGPKWAPNGPRMGLRAPNGPPMGPRASSGPQGTEWAPGPQNGPAWWITTVDHFWWITTPRGYVCVNGFWVDCWSHLAEMSMMEPSSADEGWTMVLRATSTWVAEHQHFFLGPASLGNVSTNRPPKRE